MNLLISVMVVCFSFASAFALGEDFLGAPVIPGGTTVLSTGDRLEKKYEMSYQDALKFYKEVLSKEEHVKFWDRGDATHIEDHLSRPWHSITISESGKGVDLVILKDNWTWIIGTLVLRFLGTFAVLTALYITLSISGTIISRTVTSRKKAKK